MPTEPVPPLHEYQRKRDFTRTPEPAEGPGDGGGRDLVFVVQKHEATRLHYDVRLEFHGAMVSWAVPKGPSYNPAEKRLAAHVEDHPISYNSFEGVIPRGNYGAGEVIVWDRGTYSPDEDGRTSWGDRAEADRRMEEGYRAGKISIFFRGEKLRGSWTLVRTGGRGSEQKKQWLMIKHRDEYADPGRNLALEARSVVSGLSIDDIRAGRVPSAREREAGPPAPGARPAEFPAPRLKPMMAESADQPFSRPGWLFEPKLDGIRVLAYIRGGSASFMTRNLNDVTRQYPALAEEVARLATGDVVLDGEIVALDEAGIPSFQLLQQRMNLTRPADIADAERRIPVGLFFFDILHKDGWDLAKVRLSDRRPVLGRAIDQSPRVAIVEGSEDGPALYEAVIPLGFEGVVAKRLDSTYECGARSRNWLKIKAFKS
ncbi:MAG: ATP-dependent DNA ligase, partial [Dehalococcoidia bacterium]|nr:ATP-dependent DNA ligase [Dehalococcoidia bacterium]